RAGRRPRAGIRDRRARDRGGPALRRSGDPRPARQPRVRAQHRGAGDPADARRGGRDGRRAAGGRRRDLGRARIPGAAMSSIPVPRVISAAGFVTSLGGGALPEPVRAAVAEASAGTWRPDDLQEWAGAVIADATGAESGWVTAGAAAALTLGAAACIAHRDPSALDALPDTSVLPAEIIVQRGHRNAYDRAFRPAGARIVEVGYPLIEGAGRTYEWQIEAAFSDRTVAVGHLALADPDGITLRRVCELAAAHGVPVI